MKDYVLDVFIVMISSVLCSVMINSVLFCVMISNVLFCVISSVFLVLL